MPSPLHEALVTLFRDHPALAPELLAHILRAEVPEYTEVQIDSADLTEIRPTEYRADAVVRLRRDDSVFGIVIEVQLSKDEDKGFVWPVYIATLRNRIRCPVCLLVVAPDAKVANWARQPIVLGGNSRVVPWVLHGANIPEVVDLEQANAHPELAVLSALAHGRDPDADKAVAIALTAVKAAQVLDAARRDMYVDLIRCCLSDAVRQVLDTMDPSKYQFKSDLALRLVDQGRAEGLAEGKVAGLAELTLLQLQQRFGSPSEVVQERIRHASAAELIALGTRLLSANTLSDALGVFR